MMLHQHSFPAPTILVAWVVAWAVVWVVVWAIAVAVKMTIVVKIKGGTSIKG
jgi:hypothetical protein